MKPEATRAAERILQAGGNAFDAAVAGQAVLGLVDAASNGVGSDAVILVYDAKAKTVVSINAEGTAPRLATIEWYQEESWRQTAGERTRSSRARCPAWLTPGYTLLDRWGHDDLRAGAATRESTWPRTAFRSASGWPATSPGRGSLKKYPTSVKVYFPGGAAPNPGDIFKNPRSRAHAAETGGGGKGQRPPRGVTKR